MFVFVDESGDSGMKGKDGSSPLFVMTAILFEQAEDVSACDLKINSIRNSLRMHPQSEFHFNKSCDARRKLFLEGVAGASFRHVSFVLNKAKLYGPGFAYKEPFYKRKINTDHEIIRKVKSESSHSSNLLQLADMVCGAVARSFRPDKKNGDQFKKIIGHRELYVQVWPKT
jgi:hypothetical protein